MQRRMRVLFGCRGYAIMMTKEMNDIWNRYAKQDYNRLNDWIYHPKYPGIIHLCKDVGLLAAHELKCYYCGAPLPAILALHKLMFNYKTL